MADVKISALPLASTPLAGTEVLPIVQSATTDQVSVANLTAGRSVSAASLTLTTTPLAVGSGGTGVTTSTGSGAVVLGTTPTFTTSALFPAGTVSAPGISVSGDTNTGIYFPAADTIGFVEGGVQAMTLDASGNLGIGTASPSVRLDVNSGSTALATNFNSTNASGVYIRFTNSGTAIGDIGSGANLASGGAAGDFGITSRSGNLILGSSSTERARIDNSGNLLVGTASVGVGKTTIYSATNTQAAIDGRITASGDVGTRALYLSKFDNNSTTSQILVQFAMNNGATGQGQINADGANTAAFGSYSDARLKKNIVDLPSQLSNILALRPREFDYIESEGGGHQIGFVAQEIQEIYPDAVGERADDGMLTVTAWSKTEARLVKAIQELAAKVAELEAKL